MMAFFTFARLLRVAYLMLRAAAGIVLLSHGMGTWAQNKLAK